MSNDLLNNNTLTLDSQENPSRAQHIETINSNHSSNILLETEELQQRRKRTFSHWPHRTESFVTKMVTAGFYYCNVRDRVICTSCNLICQQWIPHIDDPCDIHRTLSPNCPYVETKLVRPEPPPIINTNGRLIEGISNHYSLTTTSLVLTAPRHPDYIEIPKRLATFTTWTNKHPPSVDDLVQAGFFYTLSGTRVTCFYCNGSLQNWDSSHKPVIEHARWFPQCAYARQLCGDELYRKIQELNPAQQEHAKVNEMRDNVGQLLMPNEDTLSKKVEEKLNSLISQRALDRNFQLSTIRRCWEDQLRLKEIILQRQAEAPVKPEISNLCVLCWKEEKRLACIPCGHFAVCISCKQELRQCPICRRAVETFIKIYV